MKELSFFLKGADFVDTLGFGYQYIVNSPQKMEDVGRLIFFLRKSQSLY